MRVPRERKIALAGEALERLVHCPENTYRKTLLCECVSAYLPADEEQRRQFEEMVRNHPDPGVQAMEMGLLDSVEQRGEQRGVLKGQREVLREVLEGRFGPLPPTVLAEIDVLPGERLMDLARSILSATSLDELGLGASASSHS